MVKHNNKLNDKFTIENNYYFQLFSITPFSGTIIQNDDKLIELQSDNKELPKESYY